MTRYSTTTPHPEVDAERRRALRALLRHPLLPATGETAENYVLVRRHSEWLKDWLARFPAWTVHVDGKLARLRKVPADTLDETRPAVDRASGTAFSKRRYALLCLVLATLEQSDGQTTLAQIARSIMEFAAADGLDCDMSNYDQRRDLVHAVRLLLDIGVLRKLDGDEREFLNRNAATDVLYELSRPILASMLTVSRSPSAVQSAAELIDDPMPSDADAYDSRVRARLVRSLLDDPVLYFDELNDDERRYLEKHRGYLLQQIHEATGLLAEVRREGIAMVDQDGEGPDDHATLRLVRSLAENCRNRPGAAIPVSETYEPALLRQLRGFRLIRLTADGIVPQPACWRYAEGNQNEE
jgi:uncharacterized protein (TIGR02678 family)